MKYLIILGFVLVTRVYLEKEKFLKFLNYNNCKAFQCQIGDCDDTLSENPHVLISS